MTLKRWSIALGLAGALMAACSSKPKGSTIGDDPDELNSQGGGGGAGGSDTMFINSGGVNAAAGGYTGVGGEKCGGEAKKAEPMPVDMYIMFDQSSSMGDPLPPPAVGNWWQAATQAMTSFFNDSRAAQAHLAVGLQFFPYKNQVAPGSCNASDYATPDVEIAILPDAAGSLSASVAAHAPMNFTPSGPALKGALDHMKAWAPQHPGRAPVVVFMTDGFPTECDPQDITDIAAIAKEAYSGTPSIRTFVVGFKIGPGKENLNRIADAGGTGTAFFIDNGDIGAQFVDRMLSISSTPLQCEFDVPKPTMPGETVDPEKVAVRYTPNATQVEEDVARLRSLGDCSLNNNEGWYFDIPTNPTKIEICPGTCQKFGAGTIETVVGCKPPIGTTR